MFYKSMVRAATLLLLLLLCSCARDLSSSNCVDPDIKCYMDHSVENINIIKWNIERWSNAGFCIQILIAALGIVGAVMIAIQGDLNKKWTRPVGVVATTLATGLSSALISFHVTDNIDKMISVSADIIDAANSLDYESEKLIGDKDRASIDAAFKSDPIFREKINEMTNKFVVRFAKDKVELMRVYGSASRLAIDDVKHREGS